MPLKYLFDPDDWLLRCLTPALGSTALDITAWPLSSHLPEMH